MDAILNYPIRKLFVCELRHAVFNSDTNKWELKIKGKVVPIILVWLQGKFNRHLNYQSDQFVFADGTGEADLLIPSTNFDIKLHENTYWRVFAEIEDVNNCSGNVLLKVKKFVKLDGNEKMLNDLWYAEVVDYHKFIENTNHL